MSKVKQTAVPLPGSTSKSHKSSTRAPSKPSFKSREYIESSDDSSNEASARPKAVSKSTKQQVATKIGVHKPNGTTKRTEVPLPGQKPLQKKIVTEELESTPSSDDNDETAKTQKDLPQKKGMENTAAEENDSESDSESTSSSDSGDSSEEESAPAASRNTATGQTQQAQPSHTVEFRPALPYVPPKGFQAVATPLKSSSEANQIFQNLDGKEIWHITAPADMSISELERIAMDKALAGKSVHKHNGSDYGLVIKDESEEDNRAVLIPQKDGYEPISIPISQTFHFQQVLRLPNLPSAPPESSVETYVFESITKSTIRAPRPQVKGLKMRFHPAAFGPKLPATIGSSDGEEDEPAPMNGVETAEASQTSIKAAKRKHEDVNADEAPAKKHKKHKSSDETLSKEERRAKKEEKRKRKKDKERSGA